MQIDRRRTTIRDKPRVEVKAAAKLSRCIAKRVHELMARIKSGDDKGGFIDMKVRPILESDYIPVISLIDDWWGGRPMADMLPKLFFQHFQDTSFAAEQDGQIIGFLIGFVSQTYPTEAYIHFAGVHPDYRKNGVAKHLYHLFFDKIQEKGCKVVRCVTSPVNKTSIAFHTRMGFRIEQAAAEVDGVPVTVNYDGKGQDRVLFVKELR